MPAPSPSRRIAAALLAALFVSSPWARAETTVLENFTLIDGTGSPAAPGSAMILEDGRIDWVGPVGRLQLPKGATPVDYSGKYIIPGLIDLHVHLGNVVGKTQDPAFYTRENVERDLRAYASYGITTVQSLGTDSNLIFDIRAAQRAGRPSVTRVYTAGQGFVFKGGYGGLAGVNKPIERVAEVEPAVAEQAANGVDVIKLWVDDERGTLPKMPTEMSKAIIDSAHAHNLRAVAHVFYLEDALRLVRQGVDGLAHSVRDKPVSPVLIDAMKRRGTWQFAATLSREASMAARSEDYQQFFATAQHNLVLLAAAGVPFSAGTDSGPPGRIPGEFMHRELELMVQAGLTPGQVLAAATGRAAEFLHAPDLGTLQRSRWADFVVLDSDPLADIRNSRKIRAVYIAGKPVEAGRPRT